VWCAEAPVLTVGKDCVEVERWLTRGGLACPVCHRGRLRPWGYGRARVLRGDGGLRWRLRPRRGMCCGCGRTHVLLPVTVLGRRADAVAVIGAALRWAAAGWGHRRVAERLGRPAATVRGWLRRFRARAGPLRAAFTALLCTVDADPRLPEPAGSLLADAVAAIVAAAAAVGRRWDAAVFAVSPWPVAAAVTSGRLLAPGSTVELINTSRPW
jgi:hypothetical protein